MNKKKLQGKTIWFIEPGPFPLATEVDAGAVAAAKKLGMKVKTWLGNNSVLTQNQGVLDAVSQHAAGIILQAISPTNIPQGYEAARAAHIPVVDGINGNPNEPLGGVFTHVTPNLSAGGAAQTDYALDITKCDTTALLVSQDAFHGNAVLSQAEQAEFLRLCASCTVYTTDLPASASAVTTAPDVSGELAAHPSINVIISTNDGLVLDMASAISALSTPLPVIGFNGDAPNLQLMVSHTTETADESFPPLPYIGWVMIDQLGRAILHEKPDNLAVLPTHLFDYANLKSSATAFSGFGNYQLGFEKAWGIVK